jgi:hypothetical protein
MFVSLSIVSICSVVALQSHAINPKKGHSMLKNLDRKIEFYASKYAAMIAACQHETRSGFELYGKILGLCQAHRLLTGSERPHIALAHEAIEHAKITNLIDSEL